MRKSYTIQLDRLDLGQLLDGLELRAESWERTAEYLRSGYMEGNFIAEECSKPEEADDSIIGKNLYRSLLRAASSSNGSSAASSKAKLRRAFPGRETEFAGSKERPVVGWHVHLFSKWICRRQFRVP